MINFTINVVLSRLLKKHGSIGLLILVGDFIVHTTRSKKDDKLWNKIKRVIQDSND